MSTDDFNAHILKPEHKDKESTQHLHTTNGHDNYLVQNTPSASMNDANSVNSGQEFTPKSIALRNNVVHAASNDSFEVSSTNIPSIPSHRANFKNSIKDDHVSRTVTAKIIDLTNRTTQRNLYEYQILELLTNHLEKIDSAARLVPFGSTTYGFGGANTNFNILIDSSKIIYVLL